MPGSAGALTLPTEVEHVNRLPNCVRQQQPVVDESCSAMKSMFCNDPGGSELLSRMPLTHASVRTFASMSRRPRIHLRTVQRDWPYRPR